MFDLALTLNNEVQPGCPDMGAISVGDGMTPRTWQTVGFRAVGSGVWNQCLLIQNAGTARFPISAGSFDTLLQGIDVGDRFSPGDHALHVVQAFSGQASPVNWSFGVVYRHGLRDCRQASRAMPNPSRGRSASREPRVRRRTIPGVTWQCGTDCVVVWRVRGHGPPPHHQLSLSRSNRGVECRRPGVLLARPAPIACRTDYVVLRCLTGHRLHRTTSLHGRCLAGHVVIRRLRGDGLDGGGPPPRRLHPAREHRPDLWRAPRR